MLRGAVVPYDQVADLPAMRIDELRPPQVFPQLLQQDIAFGAFKPEDVRRVTFADVEGLASRARMDTHSFVHHSLRRAHEGGTRIEISEELRRKHPDVSQPVVMVPHYNRNPIQGREAMANKSEIRLAVLDGDGIGPEIAAANSSVLTAAAKRSATTSDLGGKASTAELARTVVRNLDAR